MRQFPRKLKPVREDGPFRLADSRMDLPVKILVSTVNLTTFTKVFLWKKPPVSFRLFVNCGYPIRSQLWTPNAKGRGQVFT